MQALPFLIYGDPAYGGGGGGGLSQGAGGGWGVFGLSGDTFPDTGQDLLLHHNLGVLFDERRTERNAASGAGAMNFLPQGFDMNSAQGLSSSGMGFDLSGLFGQNSTAKDSNSNLYDLLFGLGLSQQGAGSTQSNLFSGIEV